MSLIQAVTQAITQVLDWVGTVIGSLIDTGGALAPLLPLFAIGIAISAILLGVKIIKSTVWGS